MRLPVPTLVAVAVLATTGYAAPQPQPQLEENIQIGAPVPVADLEPGSPPPDTGTGTGAAPVRDQPSATEAALSLPAATGLPPAAGATGPDMDPSVQGNGGQPMATGAPLPGVDLTGVSTEGVTTVETVVGRFLTYVAGPSVFTYNGAVYSVTAPGTVTVTDCPCTITTTRCLGPDCYFKGPSAVRSNGASDSLATGVAARPGGLGEFNQTLAGTGGLGDGAETSVDGTPARAGFVPGASGIAVSGAGVVRAAGAVVVGAVLGAAMLGW